MEITNDIKYVGVNDHQVDLFEGQYIVPNGMSYNSYVILDEKVAVMDTVDAHFCEEWLKNIKDLLGDRKPDYLVIQHMEPDHSANIAAFMDVYKNTTIVSSAKAFTMIGQFFGTEYEDRRVVVKEGDTLALGKHTLTFVEAPMVHWPEVIVTYDTCDDESRRYFIGIVGKYGMQVQKLLKKAAALDIQTICPLHGPVLKENLGHYLHLYDLWSSYQPEEDGVVIAYASVYGHTKEAAELLASELKAKGEKVVIYDLARCDTAQAVADAFRYSKLVLATITYNAGIYPCMRDFIDHLTERNFQNREVALMENGSWAPTAAKVMTQMFEKSKNITIAENTIQIKSALNDTSRAAIAKLADELCEK